MHSLFSLRAGIALQHVLLWPIWLLYDTATVEHAPEWLCCALQTQVGSSPTYHVDKRLGKGGFGQVFLGRRAVIRRNSRDQKPHQVR